MAGAVLHPTQTRPGNNGGGGAVSDVAPALSHSPSDRSISSARLSIELPLTPRTDPPPLIYDQKRAVVNSLWGQPYLIMSGAIKQPAARLANGDMMNCEGVV